ncbi:MAG: hypothetical protein ACRDP1_05695 [Nocardioidaceae bacterium]
MSAALAVWLLLAVLAAGAVAVTLSSVAGRMDRLHMRLATAHASLDHQLVVRAAATTSVAIGAGLDPASALVLVDAVERTRQPRGSAGHESDESALTRALVSVFDDAGNVAALWRGSDDGVRAMLFELSAACERVALAVRFHNELADRIRHRRRGPLVRWFHLAGHAPWPAPVLVHTDVPAGLRWAVGQAAAAAS